VRIDVALPARPEWERVPARRLFERVRREPRPGDEIITAFRNGEVTLRSNRRVEGFTNAVQEIGYQGVRAGDLVIHSMDGFAGAIGVSDSEGKSSPVVHCYSPRSKTDPRYYAYLLRILAQRQFISSLAKGIRERSTAFDAETFRSLVLPHPPPAEQRAIADYLDAETARIDDLIAKKQQLVHLLEERRSAFISAAVTTGLESSPMRETGDDLIPAVPVGWRLMRMRHLVERIVDTPHKTAPVVEAEEYLVVRTANVKNGRLVYTGARYTDVESWRAWNRNGAPRVGDVLFTREAPAGEACVVPPDQPLCLGQRMVLLQVDRRRTTGEWLVHSIYAGPAQRFIEVYSNSTTVAHLNMSDIPDIPVAVPPLDEQSRLLSAIQHVDESVYRSKETLMDQLDLLAERRQALITAAVTGEFVVPGAA
jgi:type I restriction enzyme S subunit